MNKVYFFEISNNEEDFKKDYAINACISNFELTSKIKEIIRKDVYETYIELFSDFEDFDNFWSEYDLEATIEEKQESWSIDFDFGFYLREFDMVDPCEDINSVFFIMSWDRDLHLAFNGDSPKDIIMSKLKPFIRENFNDEYDDDDDFDEYWESSEFEYMYDESWDADDNSWWVSELKIIK